MLSASSLPSELVLLIICIAATRDRTTAATLRLVSKWVRDEVEPILYRILTLDLAASSTAKCARLLSSPKYVAHAQCLALTTAARSLPAYPLLQANSNIRNLIIDAPPHQVFSILHECFPCLQELHMFGMTLPSPTARLPHLRRLHFEIWYPSNTGTFLGHPNLTHIALSIMDDVTIGPGVQRMVMDLLAKHRPLISLLVRLHKDDNEFRKLDGQKSIDPFLTSISDRRLVVTRVDAAPVSRQKCLDEWKQNVVSGRSIWDVAEAASSPESARSNSAF